MKWLYRCCQRGGGCQLLAKVPRVAWHLESCKPLFTTTLANPNSCYLSLSHQGAKNNTRLWQLRTLHTTTQNAHRNQNCFHSYSKGTLVSFMWQQSPNGRPERRQTRTPGVLPLASHVLPSVTCNRGLPQSSGITYHQVSGLWISAHRCPVDHSHETGSDDTAVCLKFLPKSGCQTAFRPLMASRPFIY
jgi:hypothetical protein